MEQLIRLTNSHDFIDNYAFFVTGLNLVPRTGKMIISLEAFYDQFDEQFEGHKKSWKIACEGFFDHHLHAGYLRPFYQIKILTEHPVLWNYGAETFFSIQGSCKDIPSLMGDLFLIHNKICGNWVKFHRVFGFLPTILETETDNQLAAPTPLWQHYINIFQQHNVKYTVNETQQNQKLSALIFGSADFPDNYNYGQPFVAAESFEILDKA